MKIRYQNIVINFCSSDSNINRLAGVVFAGAMGLLLVACSSGKNNHPDVATTPHNVTLTAAQQKSIKLYSVAESRYHTMTDTSGVVDFDHDQSTSVLAPFSGPVTKLLVTLGQKVRKGQALAEVASPDFAAIADSYRKALAVAKAADLLAVTDSDLAVHHAISQHENAQVQANAISADADRDAALQALRAVGVDPLIIKDIQAGKSVSYPEAVIRAPIAGTVVEKLITSGQLLQAGSTSCFTIANLSRVWVMAQLFGTDARLIQPGDTADITDGSGNWSLPGKITNVSPEVDPATQSVLARVEVANPGDMLKKQMYVDVHIHSADARVGLLVPVTAILRDDENLPFTYVMQSDGSYARQHITLGYRDGTQVVIADGLHVGDRIVVDGGIFLRFIQTQ